MTAEAPGTDRDNVLVRGFDAVSRWWDEKLFVPQSTAAMGLLRIAVGLVILGWTVSMGPDLLAHYGPNGIVPPGDRAPINLWPISDAQLRWSVFEIFPGEVAVIVGYVLLLVASVLLVVGLRTRVAAVLVWVLLLALQRRNVYVQNSGDLLVRHLAFYLALMPAGAALSLDRLLKFGREKFWDHPLRPQWSVRLLQIQITMVYAATLLAKAPGETWLNGTAGGFAMRVDDLARFVPPAFINDNLFLINVMTFGTLAVELSMAVLVWNRKLRPWVLVGGILLHISIDLTLQVGFFSYAIVAGYLAFLPPEVADRLVDRYRAWRGRAPAAAPARS